MNIEINGRGISDDISIADILIDDVGAGEFDDEHVVGTIDPIEPSIGPECHTPPKLGFNLEDTGTHADTDARDVPPDPIIINSNADYIAAIEGSPTPLLSEIIELFDLRQKPYFDACVNHLGHKFITNQAMTGEPNAYRSLEKSTMSLYNLLLAKLSIEIGIKQQAILATLLSHAYHSATAVPKSNLFVPSSSNDIRNKLLEGKNSIKVNLPTPKIVELADGFIYIPMKSTIKHQFCSEHPPNAFLPFSHSVHANTPRGKELLVPSDIFGSISEDCSGPPTFPIKLLPWTDDFEPHNVVKSTGASVSVGFVTIGANDGDHSGRHTHLLWIGPQKSSTEKAEKMLADEINEMTKNPFPVYSRKHKCIVDVKPKLYAFLADRPDKCKRMSLLAGGNTHACWSYSGEFLNVIDQAVLCTSCFSKLLKDEGIGSKAVTPCEVCFSLDFNLMKYKTGDKFPKDMLPPPESSQLLPFKKVTIDHLKASCLIGFNRIKEKKWSRQELMCYLQCQGLNSEFSSSIYANGSNAALKASKHPNDYPPELLSQIESDPASFLMPEYPPLWEIDKYFGVDVFIDCPMHLLFLGTYKKLNNALLPRFLIPISKKSAAIKSINKRLTYITQVVT